MRFYKLKVTPNAAHVASTFNEQFKPEIIHNHNDPFHVDWLTEPLDTNEVFVGEKVTFLENYVDPLLSHVTMSSS
jgi:actin-related protein 8